MKFRADDYPEALTNVKTEVGNLRKIESQLENFGISQKEQSRLKITVADAQNYLHAFDTAFKLQTNDIIWSIRNCLLAA